MRKISITGLFLFCSFSAGCAAKVDFPQMQQQWSQTQQGIEENQKEFDIIPNNKINLVNIPKESKLEIKGIYGCLAGYRYNLIIHQEGNNVTIKNTNHNEIKEFNLDFKRFKVFWQVFSSIDLISLNKSYGKGVSTADFLGKFLIDIHTEDGRLRKSISVVAGRIEDKEFTKMLSIITWLVREDIDVPNFLKPWEEH